jgi:hypothetical protein
MEIKEISYSITIKLTNQLKYSNETDEMFEKRVKEEGKKRLRYFLSGYLYDPENKVFFEKVTINDGK